MEHPFIQLIAHELAIKPWQINAAVELLDNDNTIPFIARYRKEMTGSLNEVELRQIEKRIEYLRNLEKRKNEVLESIEKQGKLTEELKARILSAEQLVEVEDLYLPYRPKKHTKGQKAREMGLEPLAELIWRRDTTKGTPQDYYRVYLNSDAGLETVAQVEEWVGYLLTEMISDQAEYRETVRRAFTQEGMIKSVKTKTETESAEYEMYYDYEEAINHIKPHRILAINRGELENILKVKIVIGQENLQAALEKQILNHPHHIFNELLKSCLENAYKKSIVPAIEREFRNLLTEEAELHAIKVFGANLKNLLLTPPVRQKIIMGIDPGFRTGCKVAVINAYGEYLEGTTIYPTPPHNKTTESRQTVVSLIKKHNIDVIAIGNGTASRETEQFIADTISQVEHPVLYMIVNEAGASVYSASELALEEFPELDASMRGNISIARRLLDPLSELVKIDPKSIGVGLYQHDVNQKELEAELENVVKHCVNYVGVDINQASSALLQNVSGITKKIARSLYQHRLHNGPFRSRQELMKVPGIGEHTFQQAAGFLRIADGPNPMDNTNIHPESYPVCEKLFQRFNLPLNNIRQSFQQIKLKMKLEKCNIEKLAEELEVGEPTLQDIFENLEKPGRDPRDELPKPIFRSDILKLDDLKEGMELTGTVRNVVDFGAFVDIGIKRDALLHKSEIANRYVADPMEFLSVGDNIRVTVIKIDLNKERVSLSMRQVNPNTQSESL